MTFQQTNKIIHVQGMVCVGCEKIIELSLCELDGVTKVIAHQGKSRINIDFDESIISLALIHDKITDLGYRVIVAKSSNYRNSIITIASLVCLTFLYLILQKYINFDFIPQVRQNMGYGTLFIVGLLTSIHCVAMCGGINISQCSQYKPKNPSYKLLPSFLYNMGRVISYTILGGIIGGVGSVISFNGEFKGYVTIFVSVLMILMSLKMLKIFHIKFKIVTLPKRIQKSMKSTSSKGPFIVGLLNGFMPCGPLQSMQLYALGTGSILMGGLSMFYFSLGTVPLMFGLGALSSLLTQRFSSRIMKYSALLVFLLALSMFTRGASLAGIQLPFQSTDNFIVAESNDVGQQVVMDLTSNSYQPIQVKKDIPVTWVINATMENLNGCNNPLTIPKYNISKTLEPGINHITFTPTEEGKIVYTCWMGMITSYIDVVAE